MLCCVVGAGEGQETRWNWYQGMGSREAEGDDVERVRGEEGGSYKAGKIDGCDHVAAAS